MISGLNPVECPPLEMVTVPKIYLQYLERQIFQENTSARSHCTLYPLGQRLEGFREAQEMTKKFKKNPLTEGNVSESLTHQPSEEESLSGSTFSEDNHRWVLRKILG